ncbi:MAG TPA: flagellar motor protein MotB [Baekduia sp.]|uniref:flagellar motor protein MotB n=1 Tax=Baekduia sp. TaxID=2600305 RepID=UPI002C0311B8|nr:flagellar motor protein MotB [Baekduia sp.]HMJ33119.1 flagellar motor protein MotB [Baekduia sp.]
MAGHGKKKTREQHPEHVDERWLLTYSDLITLLMALFMVLFSISSVNTSKFEGLQHSLQEAFSGKVMTGGKSILESGGASEVVTPSSAPPMTNLQPYVGANPKESTKADAAKAAAAKAAEEDQFRKLKQKLDSAAAAKGLSTKVKTTITDEGLLIRLLTDDLLFDSGSATVRPGSLPLLKQVAALLGTQSGHQFLVSGNTDSQPIHSGAFPDNLALSGARAESIVRTFQADGLSPGRMSAMARGQYRPITSNRTAAGRSLNRRVEILVPRVATATAAQAPADPVSIPSIKPDFAKTP